MAQELVYIEENRVMTDSLMIASVFDKEHKDVLRKIRSKMSLFPSEECQICTYVDRQNKPQNMYKLGYAFASFLILGYNGKDADTKKVQYIQAFQTVFDRLMALSQQKQSVAALTPKERLQLDLFSNNPQVIAQAAQQLCELSVQEALQPLQADLEFAKAIQKSDDSIMIGDMAKLLYQNGLDIGEKRFFEWLRSNGYLHIHGTSRNMPVQKYLDQKLFVIHECVCHGHIDLTTRVTGKGQQYFINKLKKGELTIV